MGKNNRKKDKKRKVEIVFDPKSRREFLTGFRKRKNERKKRAKEELERLVKEERKRIRQEVKEGVKHLKKSYQPIPDVEDLLNEKFEDRNVTVRIIELSSNEIAKTQNFLGPNSSKDPEDENIQQEEKCSVSEESEDAAEEIPGMSVVEEKNLKPKNLKQDDKKSPQVKTKKEFDRIKQKKTLKSMQKSKYLKMKQKFDKSENKKRARKEKNQKVRELKKKGVRIRKNDSSRANKRRKNWKQ